MLGATTKHYKTYGKRKVNVVNKRVALGDTDPANNNKPLKSGGWSDSDSSDSDSDGATLLKNAVKSRLSKNKPESDRKLAASQDKENRSSRATTTSSTGLTKSKLSTSSTTVQTKSIEVLKLESSEESSSSAQPRVPLRRKAVAGTTSARQRPARIIDSEEESEEEHKEEEDTDREIEIIHERATMDPEVIVLDDDSEPPACAASEDDTHDDKGSGVCEAEQEIQPQPSSSRLPFPTVLSPLLAATLAPDAPRPFDFTSFVESPLAPFAVPSTAEAPWRKIGEASYSEVFSTSSVDGEEMVVKIIPIAPIDESGDEGDADVPFSSDWQAVKREIEISHSLGGDDEQTRIEGFVRFKGAFLVQGAYPTSLLAAWDRFKAHQKPVCDDQIRPDVLPSSQLYALLLLEHAGTDLETWKLRNWREANEIWDQVVEHLGNAEQRHGFEHRDLHWGNILIAPTPPPPARDLPQQFDALRLTPEKSSPRMSLSLLPTVKATLIDFTLSRMVRPPPVHATTTARSRSKRKPSIKEEVAFDAFEDECIFEGEGDLQFDVYRGMRSIVERDGGGWMGSHPTTNLLWLHYLVTKLLEAKKLKTPSLPPSNVPASNAASSSPFSSPGRAVSSPRKTRRHSLVFPGTVPCSSPIAILERKSRTLPSSSALLSKQHRVLSERHRQEMIAEVKAWNALKEAEETLRKSLGALLEDDGASGTIKKAKVRKPTAKKGRSAAKQDEGPTGFEGAFAFAKWWNERAESSS